MKDTLTVALEGEVISLDKFAAALQVTLRMVNALTNEVAADSGPIEWIIEGLDRGSAIATIRGRSRPGEEETVELVVSAFGDVARALESREPIARSRAVVNQARKLERLLDGAVSEIRIETPDSDAFIRRETIQIAVDPQVQQNYGAVRGRIQTLTTRGSLRFTLYDAVHDKAVSCYLQEGQQDLMRDLWDRFAIVEGLVRRDALGRAVTVRDITNIVALREPEPGRWRDAFGSVRKPPGSESAETAIRRLRDA
jgi:hypothetical protein